MLIALAGIASSLLIQLLRVRRDRVRQKLRDVIEEQKETIASLQRLADHRFYRNEATRKAEELFDRRWNTAIDRLLCEFTKVLNVFLKQDVANANTDAFASVPRKGGDDADFHQAT